MSNYRKGGDKKRMITNDYGTVGVIILIISITLIIKRIK